jgi:hypothetical protein
MRHARLIQRLIFSMRLPLALALLLPLLFKTTSCKWGNKIAKKSGGLIHLGRSPLQRSISASSIINHSKGNNLGYSSVPIESYKARRVGLRRTLLSTNHHEGGERIVNLQDENRKCIRPRVTKTESFKSPTEPFQKYIFLVLRKQVSANQVIY